MSYDKLLVFIKDKNTTHDHYEDDEDDGIEDEDKDDEADEEDAV